MNRKSGEQELGKTPPTGRLLVIDDDEALCANLKDIFEAHGYATDCAFCGKEAVALARQQPYALALVDIKLPDISGMETVKQIAATSFGTDFIYITGHASLDSAIEAVCQRHALSYETKPLDMERLLLTIGQVIQRQQAETALMSSREQLRASLDGAILAISKTVEVRDPYTAGHQRRVAHLARAMAMEMGTNEEDVKAIHMGALIHDIGKIHLPAEILAKPAKLNDLEYGIVKGHAQVGYDILKDIPFPWPVAEIARQHHERMDGSGYPQGLTGHQIIAEAKVIAVADVVEAMSSHRPYRPGLGIEAALAEIENHKGALFDPEAVDACLRLCRNKGFSFEVPGFAETNTTLKDRINDPI